MDKTAINFVTLKDNIMNLLETDQDKLITLLDNLETNNSIVNTAVEHSFRFYVSIKKNLMSQDELVKVFNLSIKASQQQLCSPVMPISLINDVLSSSTIEHCDKIFKYIEDNFDVWKSPIFYSNIKNTLLRVCIEMLKRLSQTQDTQLSGRIHLFMAKLFSINEKSGLNLMSEFSDSKTNYITSAEIFEQSLSKSDESKNESKSQAPDKSKSKTIPINYDIYKSFWSLQACFNKPYNLYDKDTWKEFQKTQMKY